MQAKEIVRNTVKEKLARNEIVASMTVRLVRGIEIAQIAKTAGFDMFYIDIEHSSFSLDITGQICLAALSAGITPMVRVPSNTSEYISRVLDGGALGVIAPHIGSAEEARAVVKAAKFSPLGERGAAGVLPHLQYRSFPIPEANAAMNDATMVIVQFEMCDTYAASPRDPYRKTAGVPEEELEPSLAIPACASVVRTFPNSPRLKYQLGRGYWKSNNFGEAIIWFRQAAEYHYAPAEALLGYMFQFGQGVPQNYPEALFWYSKAADQGFAPAQKNLGLFYEMGLGVTKDILQASEWYRKAAEQGNIDAQNHLKRLSALSGNS
jgi:hypothetical protein